MGRDRGKGKKERRKKHLVADPRILPAHSFSVPLTFSEYKEPGGSGFVGQLAAPRPFVDKRFFLFPCPRETSSWSQH